MVGRVTVFVYGVVCYLILFATFLYAIGFIGDVAVPKSIDLGHQAPLLEAMLINGALLGFLAFQRSGKARQWSKRFWTRLIPEPAERSTYILFSSLLLLVLFWQWRPIDDIVWDVETSAARTGIYAVYGLGWLIVVAGGLVARGPYRLIRYPLYFGWLLVFWATPTMTAGHLLFAIATTSYILVAIEFEERDLIALTRPSGTLSLRERNYVVSLRRNQAWANRRSWRTT